MSVFKKNSPGCCSCTDTPPEPTVCEDYILVIEAVDHDDLEVLSPSVSIIGSIDPTLGALSPVIIQLSLEGYWTRCIPAELGCDDPQPTFTIEADMYSKELWVQSTCCGECEPIEAWTRVPSMLPKEMQTHIVAPEGLTGDATGAGVDIALFYDPAISDANFLRWSSGCLTGQGGWGLCNAPYSYSCLVAGDPCTALGGLSADYTAHILYKSTRVILTQPTALADPSYGCDATITWQNYWEVGCPSPDPPPYCGWMAGGSIAINANGKAKLSTLACACTCGVTPVGSIPAGVEPIGNVLMYYGTYSWSVTLPTLCNFVDVTGESCTSTDPGSSLRTCSGLVTLCMEARVIQVDP